MKRIKIYLSSIIALMFLCGYQPIFACGHAYINGCGASVKVSVNGGASIEYGAGESSCWLQAFNNKNFGTVTSLDLTFAGQVTWESCLNNVMNGTMYYRVYKSNTTPGSFIAVPLSQFISTLQGDYTRKDRWVDTDLDFLQGLSQAGTYVVELYFKSQVDLSVCPNPWYPNVCTIGDGVADIDIFSNNSGQNYKATFTYGGGSSGTLTMNTTKTNVTCYGGNNGAATATASGGSSPYTYLWNNSATTGAITGLSAGTYSVTATDALGNVGFATLNITSPSQLNLTTTSTNETSSSANNGTASVTVSGGTSPYSGYSWSNGATTASINNLDSGTYTVTVTDASNCTASKSVFITVGTAPPPTYCASQGTPWTDWISNVTLSTINNNSGKANYTNYSNISTSLNAGSQYPISVSNSYSWTTYAEYVRVWIDYNINGTFDANEVVFEKFVDPVPPNGTVSSTLSGTFTVPATATEGATRMRVSLKRTGYATACETITYGEVEDYAIIITNGAPPACSVAASTTNILCNNNGTTTNSADDTFTFSMTVTGSNAGATGWTT
ncbi:MAG: hypothetical protein KA974_03735, partial [Saprospiraceae bacterium]|nr:hypothetical protein [Saprospiraceae bacterium]